MLRSAIKLSDNVAVVLPAIQIGRKAPALGCFRRYLPLWAVLSESFAVWLPGTFVHQWLLREP